MATEYVLVPRRQFEQETKNNNNSHDVEHVKLEMKETAETVKPTETKTQTSAENENLDKGHLLTRAI